MSLIKCTECNHEISSEAKFCPNCGKPAQPVAEKKSQQEARKRPYIIACVCVAIICLIGAAIFNVVLPAANSESYEVGSIVTLGRYEQDGNMSNGPEPIEWYVLEAQEDRALLITRYVLDNQPFHHSNRDITWEQCSLRQWLNYSFYPAAFSGTEQQKILPTYIQPDRNGGSLADVGNYTNDNVFILSISDADKYRQSLNEETFTQVFFGIPTAYAKSQGVTVKDDGACIWRSRTLGSHEAACVFDAEWDYGSYVSSSYSSTKPGVRMCIWVKIN